MSTTSCLERLTEIVQTYRHNALQRAKDEFVGKSVIANWGNRKAYIVQEVVFKFNPFTLFFEFNGSKICVAKYFEDTYALKVTVPNQPLFRCAIGGLDAYLPTEFCSIDGVPDAIRSDSYKMANVLKNCRKDPNEKYNTI